MVALVRDHLVRRRGMTEAARSAAVVVLAVAALAAGGCGASTRPAASTSPAATTAATATATTGKPATSIAGADVGRLPKVPEPTQPASLAASPATSESAFLTAVFHDAEAMWTREFAMAGLHYTPAR